MEGRDVSGDRWSPQSHFWIRQSETGASQWQPIENPLTSRVAGEPPAWNDFLSTNGYNPYPAIELGTIGSLKLSLYEALLVERCAPSRFLIVMFIVGDLKHFYTDDFKSAMDFVRDQSAVVTCDLLSRPDQHGEDVGTATGIRATFTSTTRAHR